MCNVSEMVRTKRSIHSLKNKYEMNTAAVGVPASGSVGTMRLRMRFIQYTHLRSRVKTVIISLIRQYFFKKSIR